MTDLDELVGPEVALLVPAATALVWAVRTRNAREVNQTIDETTTLAGLRGLHTMVVLLAAMVPDDEAPSRLLGWLDNPDGYLRLREQGVSRVDATETLRLSTGI